MDCIGAPGDKSKIKHNQLKNSKQYLISSVPVNIITTGDDHLLVQVSSSKTEHRPGKNLLSNRGNNHHSNILMVIVCTIR